LLGAMFSKFCTSSRHLSSTFTPNIETWPVCHQSSAEGVSRMQDRLCSSAEGVSRMQAFVLHTLLLIHCPILRPPSPIPSGFVDSRFRGNRRNMFNVSSVPTTRAAQRRC
jgi:hypothetical protein